MKITPVFAPTSATAGTASATRTITMPTNASPERFLQSEGETSVISGTSETTTEVAPEATQPLSPQLAAIAKQRRALQVKERELQDREKAMSSNQTGNSGWIDPAQLKSEPLSVLLNAGVTYDQLTEAILSSQGNPEINALKAEIQALKEGVDNRFTEQTTAQERQVLAEMQREATQLASTGDTYEMVRETNSIPDVMSLIERTYRETGEVLEVSEALQLVEDHLINESLRIASINKVQSRIAPSQQPLQQQQMRTLTNKDNARVQETRKARALAAFHGNLKK
jgi:hypothetical protein